MKTPATHWAAPRPSHIILSLLATAGFLMADAASRIDIINAAEVEQVVLQRAMAHVAPATPLLRQASLIQR